MSLRGHFVPFIGFFILGDTFFMAIGGTVLKSQLLFCLSLIASTVLMAGEFSLERMDLPDFHSVLKKEYAREKSEAEKVRDNFLVDLKFVMSPVPTALEIALNGLNRGFIGVYFFADLKGHLNEQKKLLEELKIPLKNSSRYEGVVFYNAQRKPIAYLYKTRGGQSSIVLKFVRTLLAVSFDNINIFTPFFNEEPELYMYTPASKEVVEKSLNLQAIEVAVKDLNPADICANKKLFRLSRPVG